MNEIRVSYYLNLEIDYLQVIFISSPLPFSEHLLSGQALC